MGTTTIQLALSKSLSPRFPILSGKYHRSWAKKVDAPTFWIVGKHSLTSSRRQRTSRRTTLWILFAFHRFRTRVDFMTFSSPKSLLSSMPLMPPTAAGAGNVRLVFKVNDPWRFYLRSWCAHYIDFNSLTSCTNHRANRPGDRPKHRS